MQPSFAFPASLCENVLAQIFLEKFWASGPGMMRIVKAGLFQASNSAKRPRRTSWRRADVGRGSCHSPGVLWPGGPGISFRVLPPAPEVCEIPCLAGGGNFRGQHGPDCRPRI
jgi:hypothetical protein